MSYQPGRHNRRGGNRSGHRSHDPSIGSRLPQQIREELEEKEQDDRRFQKKFVNRAANRKELRKQKRQEKGKRKAIQHVEQLTKRQKTSNNTLTNKKKSSPSNNDAPPPVDSKKKKNEKLKPVDNDEALKRLSKSNPQLYSLLREEDLVNGEATSNTRFEDDDRDIAYWEKKLGMDKKKTKGYGKAFEEDGLLDLLDGLDADGSDEDESNESYLRRKRQKATSEKDAKKNVDSLFDGLEDDGSEEEMDVDQVNEEEDDDDDDDDSISASEDDDEELGETSEEEDENDEDDDQDDDDSMEDEESEEDTTNDHDTTPEKNVERATAKAEENVDKQPPTTNKYVPPHLRKAPTTKSEQQIKLQRVLQGQLNRLNESNIDGILLEIEKCYGTYARHDVTSTITNIIIYSIAQRGNLLDSFVIPYAALIGALYRLIGVDFAAYFVQTLVETFEKDYENCKDSIARGEDLTEEGAVGAKETKNLLTLAIELYNFQVIACVLVYDIIRVLITGLNEYDVELLMKIVTSAGSQLRADDPTALKDIIDEIQKETSKRDAKTITMRHKFMLETLSNIKNNKIRNGPTSSGAADKELVLKLKKFLNGLSKKRATRSTEALRVSLDDIHNIDTKGKWWLVGASWKDNMVGSESKNQRKQVKMASDLRKDQSLHDALLKLARKQGMNTDVRRSIFVTIMSAEDYLDAFEKLMKLGLSEVQQREIARVLIQCTGNEKTFNPFYMHVGKRFCGFSHSFKVTFQYCLWDFLRECGEREVGGLERAMTESLDTGGSSKVRVGRILNVAKFYASLVATDALSLSILRSINFMTLGDNGRLWLELFFVHLFLQLKDGGATAVGGVFAKISEMRTLAQGCMFFLQETVIRAPNSGLNDTEMDIVRSSCKIAKTVLSGK
ncbi:arm repeat-containing protein [Lichtheimia corymbifera JMRC:FSU:9682]|uniref:Arm repeat-containing protein n=1 Tax=Lichtheimia corymbifera JMRC:FSU:9682 TaxID=1263082 RepID=A0A068RFI1_9FUNG|nr:arm repeat-containing protein [Lichtheimia corymbifera JMRC:FSU:9682]